MGKPAKPRMTRAAMRRDRIYLQSTASRSRWSAALDEIEALWRDLRTERRHFAAEFTSHLHCCGEADVAIARLKAERDQARRRAAAWAWTADFLGAELTKLCTCERCRCTLLPPEHTHCWDCRPLDESEPLEGEDEDDPA
jgi:hypothetical protein